MQKTLNIPGSDGNSAAVPLIKTHTLVIGSGAAGLNAALQLRANGIDDVLILTEGLEMGTSINTGSDKQTYYKLSLCGSEPDAPALMARSYFDGGSMHGDLALVEACLSPRAFMHLVNLGVPFPRDAYGQFVGYKTDHDPRQRATSIGPYTSREMCRALIREVKRTAIPVREERHVVKLLVLDDGKDRKRAAGAVAVTGDGTIEAYGAENVVFAVGGPGGLYKTSVYPLVHTGAIGLALAEGAAAQGLCESQYGLASTKFRWNVSGTYMQVVPRFMSTGPDGENDAREFLCDTIDDPGVQNTLVFLKGYQWPFDARKVIGGSSLIDILVYIETVIKGRRVFLDYRANPTAFSFDALGDEARQYLERSEALQERPIERLRKMNPGAIDLYRDHGIDIESEPLEIAVCAQHNNGGLAADHWWASTNIAHLFPVGEVNGSHGVARPGGSALNAGQVGGFRAAEYIANRCAESTLASENIEQEAGQAVADVLRWLDKSRSASRNWQTERDALQDRMSRAGAHIRSSIELESALSEAREQWKRLQETGCGFDDAAGEAAEALRTRFLCLAHLVYLDAVSFAVRSGVGSRGSAIVLDPAGKPIHEQLGKEWCIQVEDDAFRSRVLESRLQPDGTVQNRWVQRRPVPESDPWFETEWARFREGAIYDT